MGVHSDEEVVDRSIPRECFVGAVFAAVAVGLIWAAVPVRHGTVEPTPPPQAAVASAPRTTQEAPQVAAPPRTTTSPAAPPVQAQSARRAPASVRTDTEAAPAQAEGGPVAIASATPSPEPVPDYRASRIMEPLEPDGRERQRAHARCLQQVFHEKYGVLAFGSIEAALAHCATFLTG